MVGFFPGKRGLRQGDPISSSLFALSMDVLPKNLDKGVQENIFSPYPLCISPLITHLSFDDDVLIFFGRSQRSLEGIFGILMLFYLSSGLEILLKTRLFLDGNNQQFTRELALEFGLVHGDLPVRYLGLPLLPHKKRP